LRLAPRSPKFSLLSLKFSLSCRRLRVTARSSMFCLKMSAGSLLVQSIFECCMYQDTPACVAYLIGDALFAGDTLFMPDTGTARCDFPGGDARNLYRSIQRLLTLPDTTRVFVCHDYQPNGRPLQYVASIKMHRDHNVHVNQTVSETSFVTLRCQRDAGLAPRR
jgi:hypothetical protein